MKFIQGANRDQTYLFPVSLEESIGHDNVVRAVDVLEQKLDAFMGAMASADGDQKEQLVQQIDVQIERLKKYEEIPFPLQPTVRKIVQQNIKTE